MYNTSRDVFQIFRLGTEIQHLAVRWDSARQYHYSRLKDVQEVFPDAVRFKRRGVVMLFLEDENEEFIEPRRIRHCPGDTIEVVTNTASNYTPITPPTTHVQGMTPSNAATTAAPGSSHPRPVSSVSATEKLPILTTPPLQNKRPVVPPPNPPAPQVQPRASMPQKVRPVIVPAARLTPQNKTQSPLSTLQNHTPTSTTSPEPNCASEEEITAITNVFVKKVSFSDAFRQLIERANGAYDEDARKITLTLTSSFDAKQFFGRLVKEGKELRELDVTLAWDFNASDSEILVTNVYKTSVNILRLDLQGTWDERPESEQTMKGDDVKYYSLHTLLWNKNLKGLIFENTTHFGPRTNLPPMNKIYSNLRLLHFLVKIEATSEDRICTLIGACPNLRDLRIGTFQAPGNIHPKMECVIGNLKKLKALHIYNTTYSSAIPEQDKISPRWRTIPQSDKPIKEIVRTGIHANQLQLQEVIGRSCGVLEVLMLHFPNQTLELRTSATSNGSTTSSTPKAAFKPTLQKVIDHPYTKLTHLDLQVVLSTASLTKLCQVLPQLSLTHLGVNDSSKDLLKYAKFETLESISLTGLCEADLDNFKSESLKDGRTWKLHTIRLRNIKNIQPLRFLLSLPMKRVFLSEPSHESLMEALANLDFSILEVLSILTPEYDWDTEEILASQAAKFNIRTKVELGLPRSEFRTDVYDEMDRPLVGTKQKLARGRVEILPVFRQLERYIQSVLPPHSVAK
ncbi:hypothetical protein BGX23_001840 [Mortierella sp. AD031]|nr:hypothetical protein BGX23_001840 [Mortierella sp. AD031]